MKEEFQPLTFSGKILKIETVNNNGNDKKVVTIAGGSSNVGFFDFFGKYQELLNGLKKGDEVLIKFRLNGKVSKLGVKHNNNVGKSIKLI